MSLLDIDELLFALVDRIELDRGPLTDLKHCSEHVDVGLVEGGLANADNVEVLREFRARCDCLVAVGACAITGGVPSLRNRFTVAECLREAYVEAIGVENPGIPFDAELPLLLDKLRPIHEVVRVDYVLPGCPPPAAAFRELITALLEAREPVLPRELRRFD
jgi:NAD-reducing hydrogenase small subunit